MVTQANRQRKVLISGGLFHIYHDSIADGLAVLLPFWKLAFDLSLAQVGLVITCFESATALFQVPAGFLGERYGERIILTLGTIATAVCFLLIGFAGHIYALGALLIIGGLGAGVQHPLAAAMISKAYACGNRRVVLGTYNFTGDMGKFLFPAMAAGVFLFTGWRSLCVGYGAFGVVLAAGLYWLLRRNHTGETETDGAAIGSKNRGWGIVRKKAFSLLACIGFIDTAVRAALITFLPFILIEKNMPMQQAGLALALLFIGGALGKFLCGILAESIGVIPSIVITEAMSGLGIIYVYAMPLSAVLPFLPILGLALHGTSSVLYGTVADFVSPTHVARAFGLFYTVIIAAAAVAPPIFGMFSDARGLGITTIVLGLTALFTLPVTLMLRREMQRSNSA